MKNFIILFLLFFTKTIFAQSFCNTASTLAESDPTISSFYLPSTENYMLRVAVHIIRHTDGTGGMTLAELNNALTLLKNSLYPHNICISLTSVEYIDDNTKYEYLYTVTNLNNLVSFQSTPNNINIYMMPSDGKTGGIARSIPGTALMVGGTLYGSYLANSLVLAHEFGHLLGLWHTFHGCEGGGCLEYVDGSNCATCGDLVCDTPADPASSIPSGFSSLCIWTGYSCTGSTVDIHGDTYNPDANNIMAYTKPNCMSYYSNGQGQRMRDFLSASTILAPVIVPNIKNIQNITYNSGSNNFLVLDNINIGQNITTSIPEGPANFTNTSTNILEAGEYISVQNGTEMAPTSGFSSLTINPNMCSYIDTLNDARLTSIPYTPLLNKNTWLYLTRGYDTGGAYKIQYLNDTVIGSTIWEKYNESYSHIYDIGYEDTTLTNWYSYGNIYLREDTVNKIVYKLNTTTGISETYFSFNINIGDSYYSSFFNDTITAVDTFTILNLGTTFKVIKYLDNSFGLNYINIAEGLGFIGYETVAFPYRLVCSTQDSILIYHEDPLFFPIIFDINCNKFLNTTALSLDILHFSASSTCDEVTLQWGISHDENIDYFTLQRSLDAQNWETVAHIPALNNGNAVNNYSYKDPYKATANTYYRIASTSKNAIQDYSSIQTVKNNCNDENTINIRPNPSSGIFSIHSTNQNITKISVLDVLGKEVYHHLATKKATLQTIDISTFANGIYLLHITTENGLQSTHKLVKY